MAPLLLQLPLKNKFVVDGNSICLALALVLVIEGLLPMVSPISWRKAFSQFLKFSDGQIRFFGLCCFLFGAVAIGFLI